MRRWHNILMASLVGVALGIPGGFRPSASAQTPSTQPAAGRAGGAGQGQR